METPAISILLSTFNGEKFLREQLDSILAQRFSNWVLIIRDDGSTDSTPAIIAEYVSTYPGKIRSISDTHGNIGAKKSFSVLLKQVTTPYAAFCDQDDAWLPEKLEKQMQSMQEAEQISTAAFPVLVYSDLTPVSETLQPIAASFLDYSGLSPQFALDSTLLLRNVAPGCSMLFNRSLAEMAADVPEEAVMHDYWLMLFARYKGVIVHLPEPLVLYRQHGANSLGADQAAKKSWKKIFRQFGWYLKGADFYLDQFKPYILQAAAFLKRFPENDPDLAQVRAFLHLRAVEKRLGRKYFLCRYRLRAGNFRDNIELLLCG